MVSITCPACARVGSLKVAPPAGAKVRCPGCGERFEAPATTVIDNEVLDSEDVEEVGPEPVSSVAVASVPANKIAHESAPSRPQPLTVAWFARRPILVIGIALVIFLLSTFDYLRRSGAFEPNHRALGHAANDRGDFVAAEGHYRQSLVAPRADRSGLNLSYDHQGLGTALRGLKRYSEAIQEFHRAIRCIRTETGLDPLMAKMRRGELYAPLGLAELAAGQVDAGLEHYALAVQEYDEFVRPDADGSGLLNLARCYQNFKRYDEADETIGRAFRRYQDLDIDLGMAECYDRWAELLRESRPDDGVIQRQLADQAREAREVYRRKYGDPIPKFGR